MAAVNGRRDGTVRAAGGVVWRETARGDVEIVLVHRPRYDDWTLPKGKLEPDEHPVLAAVREKPFGGPDAERSELVERECPVREVMQHVLDAVELGVPVGVRRLLPRLGALEGDTAAGEQAS